MNCERCGKNPATVHVTIDPMDKEKRREVHVCVECKKELASERGGQQSGKPGGSEKEPPNGAGTVCEKVPADACACASETNRAWAQFLEAEGITDAAPIVKLVSLILVEAIRVGASEIHLEPLQDSFRVRYRIHGILRDVERPPKRLAEAVMQRIKVMAGLDIAERRKPQTGRIELCVSDQRYSLLVSTAPTVDGECCILRIVPGKAGQTRLDQVCLEDTGLAVVRKWLERSHGLILVSGPTGSGKTTTLHAMVNEVKGPEKVIMGVECPVSARLDGVSHLLVRPEAGFGFPQAIRTAVSQICDVIFVSDLPDAETVEAACHAASAGCLVLACAAADSAPATITRLLQTGCRPQLLAAALIGVTNQRLIRKVCGSCREETALDSLSPAEREFIGAFQIEKPCRGKGCEQCNNTGYRWRVAVYELLEVNDALSEAIAGQRPSRELMEIAVRSGMKRLRESGLAKVSEGVTTVGELLRVLARLPDGR